MSAGDVSADGRLRILHVIASMAVEAGGPPVVCAGLAGALANRGHALSIVAVGSGAGQTPMPQVAVPSGVALHLMARDGSPRYAKSAALGAWLSEHIKDFDIVHLHSIWQYPTFAAARACRRNGVPYISLLHGMLDRYSVEQRSYWLKRAYWFYRERKVQAGAAAIHCLNKAEIRRAVPWIAGMPKFMIPNGIGESELGALPARGDFRAAHPEIASRPMALFLSRLHPKKGLERLIPAWRALAARMPEAMLVIAGTGEAEHVADIDRLIAEHGLEKQVIRVGQLTGKKKWEALVDADVFVLPSHQEGFSMAITEVLAAGCPAVVTQECNFDELEDSRAGNCGVIIRNGDMVGFVGAAESLLQDSAARAAMGARGAALVRSRYTWEKIAVDLEKAYRYVLAGKSFSAAGDDGWR